MSYKRVLLKLSGETLAGKSGVGIDVEAAAEIAREIAQVQSSNVELAVVIGAGNLWRGASQSMERTIADQIGMVATVMNALAVKAALHELGLSALVQSAFGVSTFVEPFDRTAAVNALSEGTVVIFAGGTGNPFFTTDTTAALRAAEIDADVLLKATQVDGVYSSDPKKDKNAKRYAKISYDEAIQRNLKIMDTSAFSICKEQQIPIVVFNFHVKGTLGKVLAGEDAGTIVS